MSQADNGREIFQMEASVYAKVLRFYLGTTRKLRMTRACGVRREHIYKARRQEARWEILGAL